MKSIIGFQKLEFRMA